MRKLLIAIFLMFSLNAWAAFPTTPILDTATRANENPLSNGGKWTLAPGFGNLQISSNKIITTASSVDDAMYWNNFSLADEEVYCTVGTILGTTADHVYLLARFTASTTNGYYIEYDRNTSTGDVLRMGKLVAGVATSFVNVNQNISAGDSFGLVVIGNILQGWYKASGGSWTHISNFIDTTYTGVGNIATDIASVATGGITNFGGGMVVTDVMFGDIL